MPQDQPYRILTLDGGGAKGFYTLGVLREIEGLVGRPLCECFDLIFGTSTGAIIATLLALGRDVDTIHQLYRENVPRIMRPWSRGARSRALGLLAKEIFGDLQFSDVKTNVGIVATKWHLETPMIFKSNVSQAHGRKGTFTPGFGASLAEAVQASCSAYPYFRRKQVVTSSYGKIDLLDGGYCANNPTLYAIADAVTALHQTQQNLRVINIGVGVYRQPLRIGTVGLLRLLPTVRFVEKILGINALSMEQLRSLIFTHVPTIRISDTFAQPELAVDLIESDPVKLNLLYLRGRESFGKHEGRIKAFLMTDASRIEVDS